MGRAARRWTDSRRSRGIPPGEDDPDAYYRRGAHVGALRLHGLPAMHLSPSSPDLGPGQEPSTPETCERVGGAGGGDDGEEGDGDDAATEDSAYRDGSSVDQSGTGHDAGGWMNPKREASEHLKASRAAVSIRWAPRVGRRLERKAGVVWSSSCDLQRDWGAGGERTGGDIDDDAAGGGAGTAANLHRAAWEKHRHEWCWIEAW